MTKVCIDVCCSGTSDSGTLQVFQDFPDLLSLTFCVFKFGMMTPSLGKKVKEVDPEYANRFLYCTDPAVSLFCMCSAGQITYPDSARLLISLRGRKKVRL
jgi:hypothetical protein